MYKELKGKKESKIIVNNDTACGNVELTLKVKDKELYAQLSNGELFSLALALLECVEHTR
ncbi:MAG: hypothetical protein DRJ63_08610 [Thermoprotei archaeon]|nr:MAG: hypothetical protein DRJ63_08610 [Thermoprotei archaeon]